MAERGQALLRRHQAAWEELERALSQLDQRRPSLAELWTLDRLYRRAAADLAQAATHDPGGALHQYLNQLCARAYRSVYRPPPFTLEGLRRFFAAEVPAVFRRRKLYVGVSAFIFLLGALAGALTLIFEPGGAELLVPAGIRASVAHHKMWTDDILGVLPPGTLSSAIATNNLSVAVLTFASGLAFGLGSALSLFNNGLHIGSVAALCVQQRMGGGLLAFVAAHGVVELSVIVTAGGAGLLLGHAVVAPGERSRGEALRHLGKDAVKLCVGTAPFLGAIALVEGFVSPGALFPTPLKIALGAILGVGYWAYLGLAGRAVDARAGSTAADTAERRS